MYTHHWAPFRREESLASSAMRAREVFKLGNQLDIDVFGLIKASIGKKFGENGDLNLVIFNADHETQPAEVSYNPLTLRVDEELWDLAKYRGPFEKFVLTHELAHIVLHGSNVKAFSGKYEKFTAFGSQEHDVEWQANTWAQYFLIPDELITKFYCVNDLKNAFNVDENIAQICFQSAKRRRLYRKRFDGEICPECANFTLVRNGICLKCETCGATTGCS